MNRRSRVIAASAFTVMGFASLVTLWLGQGQLEAAAVGDTGTDLTAILLWVGIGLLVLSAFLYISASSE